MTANDVEKSNAPVQKASSKGWLDKVGDYFESAPSERSIYWKCIILAALLLPIIVFCLYKSGIVFNSDPSILPNELDLSGEWKISYHDDPKYADPSLDDSNWCHIAVPDASLGKSEKREGCPESIYPVELMRNHTYWYRRWVDIPKKFSLEKPSLYLGAIKREAWIYWDGGFIGSGRLETAPTVLPISKAQIPPGRHLLAVKVSSSIDQYPGIFHAHNRKVSIGEFERNIDGIRYAIRSNYIEPFVMILTQLLALLVLIYLVLRTNVVNEKFFWLTVYFGSSTLYSSSVILSESWKWLLSDISNIVLACSLAGYSATVLFSNVNAFRLWKRGILLSATFAIALKAAVYFRVFHSGVDLKYLDKVLIGFSLLFTVTLVGMRSLQKSVGPLNILDWLNIFALMILSFSQSLERIFFLNRAVFFHQQLINGVLTVLVVGFAIEDHIQKEKHLAFFGRFIRKGLKQLLVENEKSALSGEKMFRGRKVIVMKIDIIGHTETTYGMPYGMKRIFQDCWFTTIDQIVAKHTFLDKTLGDGSLYYFDISREPNLCRTVLDSLLEIQNVAVREFDRIFRRRVEGLIKAYPEISTPAGRFFANYKTRQKMEFMDRKTRVRFVLCAGFVDEGLWGMLSQGHYDVEGDLVTLSARLEKKADADHIVVNEEFVEMLRREDPSFENQFELEWKEADLKGLGMQKFGMLQQRKNFVRKIA